jgi:hypothetical protein
MPAPILKRPRLVGLGASPDPVASNMMAEVPRRKAPSVEIGDVRDITSPLHSRACWNEAAGSVGAQETRPKMTERASRSIVAASTTDLAEVRTVDREVGSVDARLRRRRKLAPARSKSSTLPAALRVIIDKPCAPPRNRPSAPKFPPPCGPCLAIEAGLSSCQGLFFWEAYLSIKGPFYPLN